MKYLLCETLDGKELMCYSKITSAKAVLGGLMVYCVHVFGLSGTLIGKIPVISKDVADKILKQGADRCTVEVDAMLYVDGSGYIDEVLSYNGCLGKDKYEKARDTLVYFHTDDETFESWITNRYL